MTLPRVTSILAAVGLRADLSMVPEDVLRAAQERGAAIHRAVEGYVYGYDTVLQVDDLGYYKAWMTFLKDSGFKPTMAEIVVQHPAWGYVGHPDVIGWMGTERTLIDVKTGDATGAAYQVAGYVLAWNAESPDKITAAGVLHLRDDGSYRYEAVDLAAAESVWLAAVIVHQAQGRRAA